MLISAYPVFQDYLENRKQEQFYQKLDENDIVSVNQSVIPTEEQAEPTASGSVETEKPSKTVMKKYEKLLKLNKEVIGWVKIENSQINYPIVQHEDNTYYLTKASNQEDSSYGSIYLDYRNEPDFQDHNNIIYGHNMKDGSMFHNLINYKDEDFFEKNKIIVVSDLYEEFSCQVFAVYVVDASTEKTYVKYTEEDFLDYIKECKERSLFKTDINVQEDDRIITLITCSYEYENARTVVQAKIL
ncbi:sortase B [Anaeromicropila populeti]|uniref:Sortase B n=1 Tax=Anaeromicropila populeti TaxID=37658 RepID=A0A1I6JPL3_9FIRM|nr:sortase B [Anaeromicropila populeti]